MIAQLTVIPIGSGESLRELVTDAVSVIDRSKLDYQLTAMGTIIEGDWDRVMQAVKKVRDHILKRTTRVYFLLTIDEKRSTAKRMAAKVQVVQDALTRRR